MRVPSTGDWVAAGLAAGLVVVLTALHLLRPVLRRSQATPWGRLGGFLLGALAAGFVLVVVVAVVAATTAGGLGETPPAGRFAAALVNPESVTAGRVAGYVTALLLPLAAVLGVLAVAVVDLGGASGLRFAALVAAVFVMLSGAAVAIGDTGTAASGTGWAALVVAAGAAAALAVDALDARRARRASAPSPAP